MLHQVEVTELLDVCLQSGARLELIPKHVRILVQAYQRFANEGVVENLLDARLLDELFLLLGKDRTSAEAKGNSHGQLSKAHMCIPVHVNHRR